MKRTRAIAAGSLFTAKARGGVIGGLGYNFQDAYVVTVLPRWLAEPDFKSFIKEGFDDVDVVFGDASVSSTRHYQLKDHEVSLSEFRQVIEGFAAAARRPGVNATSFVLGCCGVNPKVRTLWMKIQELRGARKTHSDAALKATKMQLLSELKKQGLAAHADLLLDALELDYENPGLRDVDARTLKERFRGAFMALPLYRGHDAAVLDRLFERLMVRVNKAVRSGISRDDVEALITTELAAAVKGPATVVHLHGWTRQAYDLAADEEVDWTQHFNHATLRVPAVDVWEHDFLPQLRTLRERLDRDGRRRMICLRARAPLSAGLAFGHAFAEAAGYSIRVQQPSPGAKEALQDWEIDAPAVEGKVLTHREVDGDLGGDEVVVAIGVTDDPEPKVSQYLATAGLKIRSSLYLAPAGGASATALDARTVGTFASAAKREIRRLCNRHSPRLIHLFYFGPLGLAVLLGQKLNGLADIQCYERDKAIGYVASCRLPA